MNGQGIEAVLDDNSVFSLTVQTESIYSLFLSTVETGKVEQIDEGNRASKESAEKKHQRNFLGKCKGEATLSKAHGFPNDQDCNLYWWPMLRMVSGSYSTDWNQSALDKMAAMKTNKIAFPCPHNHYYDDLAKGCVCTIPIFTSIEEIATAWDYGKDGYEMLIVCDSLQSYSEVKMNDDSFFDHIAEASPDDVRSATALVAEMTKVLADSLVSNWDDHYKNLEDRGGRKNMLETMKNILTVDNNNRVHIPILSKQSVEDIKLYKIDYRIMYTDGDKEGKKYIPDPFTALIKSAVNLSAFVNKKLCVEK